MAINTLTNSYLTRLSVANHDGVTQQICDRLTGFTTDNQMLIAAREEVVARRADEDFAFKRFSDKDFVSDDLKKADRGVDQYMSTIRGVLNGLLYLPEDEPLYRKTQEAVQVFKDFHFSTSDGMEAESRKVVNMYREWKIAGKYDLDGLGILPWVEKANTQAERVLQLVTMRVDNEAAKVKGELANARKATDEAIRKAYDVINALMVLAPSAELSALVNVLLAIEDRAKQYYINSGKPSGSSGSSSGNNSNGGSSNSGNGGTTNSGNTGTVEPGGSEQGGTTTPDTPENPGGSDNGGGTGSITPVTPGGDDNGEGGDTPGGDDNSGGGTGSITPDTPGGGDNNGGGNNSGGGGGNDEFN